MRWLLVALALASQGLHAETLSGRVITVIDGDTLTLLDEGRKRHRVRLAGIDAPERGQPFYVESARSLAQLCYRKPATVETDRSEGDIVTAKVKCAEIDANGEQVRRGMAWTSKASAPLGSALVELEAYARLRHLGLWKDPSPVPPWDWRAKNP